MNILLIGGSNSLINALIRKFNKEGHRVSLLTGSGYRQEAYEHVFERHDFSYASSSLTEVFESVSPDVTIFMGAHDSSFRWSNDQGESVRYISGMMNLLTAYATLHRGRFIYLSSGDVFSGRQPGDTGDDTPTDAIDFRGMAIAQGEELCDSFRVSRELDIMTLRLGGYYHRPASRDEVDSAVASFCLEALWDRSINVGAESRLSVLNESDAVEFIGRAAAAPEHRYARYNLTSGDSLSERELAEMIRRQFQNREQAMRIHGAQPLLITDDGPDATHDLALDSTRFQEEFGMHRFRDTEEAIGGIVSYMLRHRGAFLQDTAPKPSWKEKLKNRIGWLVKAVFPFVENLICFIPFFMLNNRAVGSHYFAKLDFYLLYVLLFAIMYGQQQATVSAILATCGYIFRQMYNRTGFEVLLDFNTYVWIAQLFILGLVVGYMKDKLAAQREEAREDHMYMVGQLDDIKTINSSNVRVKDAIQTEVINQSDSVGKIYKITSALSQYSYEEVLFYATDILKQIMGTEDVSIYNASGGAFARLFTATSERARSLGHSVKYEDLGDLYEEISQRRVFINRKLAPDLPMMADAIYDDDAIRMIIMIWRLPWEKMTLGQANLLTVTDALIRDAVLRANRYLDAVRNERFIGNSPVLNEMVFSALVQAYENAERRGLTEYSLVWVEMPAELRYARHAAHREAEPALPEPREDPAAQTETPNARSERKSVGAAAEERRAQPARQPFGEVLRHALGVGLCSMASRALGVELLPQDGAKQEDDAKQESGEHSRSPVQEDALRHMLGIHTAAEKKAETSAAVQPTQAELAFGERLSKQIRPNDYVGEFDNGDLYVLLTNTDTDSAKFVIGRLERAGFQCRLVEHVPWQE